MNNNLKQFENIIKYFKYSIDIEICSMNINSIHRGRIDHYNSPVLNKYNRWVYLVDTTIEIVHKKEGYIVEYDVTIPLYCSSGTNSGKKEGQLYPFLGLKPNCPDLSRVLCTKIAGTNLDNVSKHWIMKSPFYSYLKKDIWGVSIYNKDIPKEQNATYGYGFTNNSILFKKFAEECTTFNGKIIDFENNYYFTKRLNHLISGENNLNIVKLAILTLSMIGVNVELESLNKYIEAA